MNEKNSKINAANIIKNQKYAVVATQGLDDLYTTLIAYYSTDDLKNIYFVTSKRSKKYRNLIHNPNVSLLIDDRKNKSSDLLNATAITAIGQAFELKDNLSKIINLFINKHPKLKKFIESPESVLIDVKVDKYIFVNNFQNKNILNL